MFLKNGIIAVTALWIPKGDTLTESGIYADTLAYMTSCDSALTLNLTIITQ